MLFKVIISHVLPDVLGIAVGTFAFVPEIFSDKMIILIRQAPALVN